MTSFAAHLKRAPLADAKLVKTSLAMVLSSLLGISSAYAAGTNAGTSISNTATVSYTVNSVSQSDVTSTPATFLVDRKIDVNVTQAGVTTQPSANDVATTFVVTNEGNAADSFTLQYSYVSGIDISASYRLIFDANNNGIYEPLTETTVIPNSTVVPFALDEARRYFVVSNIPNTATNGQTSLVNLTATTTTAATPAGPDNPAVVEVVYAEGAGPAYDGAISAVATYTISSAVLALTKTVQVVSDPTGAVAPNAKAIPGAVVQYTITATNAPGAGQSATGVNVTDAIPATLTYVLGSIGKTGGSAPAPTDANVVGNALSVPVGTLAPSDIANITFRATIN
jgi:uncharacterized repeat protein (TIGR01451 family)